MVANQFLLFVGLVILMCHGINALSCTMGSNNNPDFCGGCSSSCSSNNIVRHCTNGVCDGTCSPGWSDCNNNKLTDGCEFFGSTCPGYWVSGVQNNVPVANLLGWSLCYSSPYGQFGPSLATIQAQCNQANILMACAPNGATTLQVLAMANAVDVYFNTGNGNNNLHTANGVGWYFSGSTSWGFTPAGTTVSRSSCDIQDSTSFGGGPTVTQRICWHTSGGSISGGFRCGANDFLNGEPSGYTRYVYQAPLFWASGVLNNIPKSSLIGWNLCYSSPYGQFGPSLATIQAQCTQSKLLMACAPNGATTLQVLAMANAVDVYFNTGDGNNNLHTANGVGWYFSGSTSWGFTPAGTTVSRSSCDIQDSTSFGGGPTVTQRICWHTSGGNISGGFRCGANDFLNGEPSGYTRYVYQAP